MERRGWGADVYVYVKLFHAKKNALFERQSSGDLLQAPFHSSSFPHRSGAKRLSLPVQFNAREGVQHFTNSVFFPKGKPGGLPGWENAAARYLKRDI